MKEQQRDADLTPAVGEWRDVTGDSWSFLAGAVLGESKGIGSLRTAYCIYNGMTTFLNGFLTAQIRITEQAPSGAGVILRADEQYSFIAVHVSSSSEDRSMKLLQVGCMNRGIYHPIATNVNPLDIGSSVLEISVEFFSGDLHAVVAMASGREELRCKIPHLPFPGYVGLVLK